MARKAPSNVTIIRKGKELIITVPNMELSLGQSESGKSNMVATTHGIFNFEGFEVLLNVGKPNETVRAAERALRKDVEKQVRAEMKAKMDAIKAAETAALAPHNAAIDKANGVGVQAPRRAN